MNIHSIKPFLSITVLIAAVAFGGCFSTTRTEIDLYSVTQRDTTVRETMHNTPGERENGTIYPSPRSVEVSRNYLQHDSTVERHYPAFLRFGFIETASFLAGGGINDRVGNGLFGLYDLITNNDTGDTKFFTANMYRLLPYEVRLRWFEDDPNWTIGTAASEIFVRKKTLTDHIEPGEFLWSVAPLYIHKRFFLREDIPYLMVVPFFGLSLFPSQYVNLGASLDLGSYGGMNIRAYAGYITGSSSTFFATKNDTRDFGMSFPYFGVGVSALDFVNKTEELFIEWKDHKHSALEISWINFDMVKGLSGNPAFGAGLNSTSTSPTFPSGFIGRMCTATYPIPIDTSGRFFVGTSLLNIIAISNKEIALGFLPIRAGYRFNILEDQFNFEPFAEYTYYPGSAFHLGGRLVLKISEYMQINGVAGYVTGSQNLDVLSGFEDLRGAGDFSGAYIGVGLGIGDVFHSPQEIKRK